MYEEYSTLSEHNVEFGYYCAILSSFKFFTGLHWSLILSTWETEFDINIQVQRSADWK